MLLRNSRFPHFIGKGKHDLDSLANDLTVRCHLIFSLTGVRSFNSHHNLWRG